MKIHVKSKYIIVPVNPKLPDKHISFLQNGKEVYYLDVKLDNISPCFEAYADVTRFIGTELDLNISPEMNIIWRESNTIDIPDLYHEPMRPQVHFSTKNGWNNDPNGMIFLDGVYHMFYQHNPCDPTWGNMHWGHAVSRDLLHWEEKEIALFPDQFGTMFSGSAVLDSKNITGFSKNDTPPVLLYYTAAGTPYTQCLAYSCDGLKTIQKYDGNPIIPYIIGRNRDPKVVWCEELNSYLLALYLSDDRYLLFTSNNMINWQILQEIILEGDNECPDLYCMKNDNGERRWVFIGAHDRYLVGEFKEGKFVPTQPVQTLHFGSSGYAAQSFSNLPEGRNIRVSWMRWNHISEKNFSQQMGIPVDLSLKTYNGIEYLCATPVPEIQTLFQNTKEYSNIVLDGVNTVFFPVSTDAQLIRLEADLSSKAQLTLGWFGRKMVLDMAKNKLSLQESAGPLSITKNKLDVTILIDRCSVEIFADGGRIYFADSNPSTVCDFNIPQITLYADRPCVVNALEIHALNPIWE